MAIFLEKFKQTLNGIGELRAEREARYRDRSICYTCHKTFSRHIYVETGQCEHCHNDPMLMPKLPQAEPDLVNHPPHYTHGGIECIEAIKAALGAEGFKGYLKGAILKYLWRADHKGSKVQDLKKAEFYLTRLIEEEDGVKSESNS